MRAWMCLCGCGCKDVPGSQMKCPRGFRLGGGGETITTPGSWDRCFNTTVPTGCCWSIADALAFVAFSVRGNRPARAATRGRSATWPRLPNLAAGNTRPAVELCGPSGPRLRSAAPSSYRGRFWDSCYTLDVYNSNIWGSPLTPLLSSSLACRNGDGANLCGWTWRERQSHVKCCGPAGIMAVQYTTPRSPPTQQVGCIRSESP